MTSTAQVEYDPFAAHFYDDPFTVYRWMRDEAPVYYSERWGWWALSRFDDVRAAATDPDTFRSFEGIDIDDTAKDQSGPGFLPDIDNPRHDQLRKLVQPHFLPRRIAAQEGSFGRSCARWSPRGPVQATSTSRSRWRGRCRTRCSSTCWVCPVPGRRDAIS